MLSTSLLSLSLGDTSPTSFAAAQTHRELLALQPAPGVRFDGGVGDGTDAKEIVGGTKREDRGIVQDGDGVCAHGAGVNALVVDRFEGR